MLASPLDDTEPVARDNARMTGPRDPATRATRLAANAAALAVVVWAALYLVTTQIPSMRVASPFAEDPWDAVVSYAAIFLPLVVGATWIRSLRHRGTHLEAATARRIHAGVGIALVTIAVNVASDAVAVLVVSTATPDGRLALIIGLLVAAGAATVIAAALLVRAMRLPMPALRDVNEPDVLDDLLGLVAELPGATRVVQALDRFLADSPVSPRRHRLVFGVIAAALAGLAFDVWHALIEGPWTSVSVLILFGTLVAGGVFVVYAATLVPLRLIRPAN